MTKIVNINRAQHKDVGAILDDCQALGFEEIFIVGLKRNASNKNDWEVHCLNAPYSDTIRVQGILRVLENHLFENWD